MIRYILYYMEYLLLRVSISHVFKKKYPVVNSFLSTRSAGCYMKCGYVTYRGIPIFRETNVGLIFMNVPNTILKKVLKDLKES